WTSLTSEAGNTMWPDDGVVGGGPCSDIVTGGGDPAVLDKCAGVNGQTAGQGSVCFAGLPDVQLDGTTPGQDSGRLVQTQVRNATNTQFVPPASAFAANCDTGSVVLPGLTTDDAVGLNSTDNWATDNAPNRGDVTNKGKVYPICGLTWDLVYA